jgi:hypothetical protein
MPPADVTANQAEFRRRFDQPSELATWLEGLLRAPGAVRAYKTDSPNPSQQLKNKLSQAAPARNGLLVLLVADEEAHDLAKTALKERWAENDEWPKAVSCVALAYPRQRGAEISSIVEWRPSDFPDRIRRSLSPNVDIVAADGSEVGSPLSPRAAPALARELHLDVEWVEDCLWMLTDKRALILYGPPGTGKTFIAQRLAAHVQPDGSRRRLVQLHPSYSYEDFVEGFRPTVVGDKATLTLEPGPLRQLAKTASDDATQPVILVMDEINRGNLPRVFGELFFLLEYRDQSVSLMYSPGKPFTLPRNLYLIGTMNTADRSIALMDQALRRRFHFAPLFPGEPPVNQMLRRFLAKHRPDMEWVADLLDRLNAKLNDRNTAIGPSHFMRLDLDEQVLRRVWRASVMPTVEELLHGQASRLKEFDIDRLRQ